MGKLDYSKIFIKEACPTSIGGQAVMEGVMMQGPDRVALAMRMPSGNLYLKTRKKTPDPPSMKIPFVRGIVAFARALVNGMTTLMESADILEKYAPEQYSEEPGKVEAWINKKFGDKAAWNFLMATALLLAVLISVLVFIILPTWAVNLFSRWISSSIVLNLIEGILRIAIFIAYVAAIRKMEDMMTLFRYHGAEHKSIHCFENGLELTPENAQQFYTLHPRCGTSFLVFVLIISLLLFSFLGWPSLLWRILSRILLIPVIAGISFELLKWAGRSDGALVKALSWPGLMLQKLTTAEPTVAQLEVGLLSLKAVLVDPETPEIEGFVDAEGKLLDDQEGAAAASAPAADEAAGEADGSDSEEKPAEAVKTADQEESIDEFLDSFKDAEEIIAEELAEDTETEPVPETADAQPEGEAPDAEAAEPQTEEPQEEESQAEEPQEEEAAEGPETIEELLAEEEPPAGFKKAQTSLEDYELIAGKAPDNLFGRLFGDVSLKESAAAIVQKIDWTRRMNAISELKDRFLGKINLDIKPKDNDTASWDELWQDGSAALKNKTPEDDFEAPDDEAINEAIQFLNELDKDGYTMVAPEECDGRTIAQAVAEHFNEDARTRTLARRYTNDITTIENALKWGQAALSMVENGRNEAVMIMSYATGLTRTEMITRGKELMRDDDFEVYEERIQKRLTGTPLQYILGVQEFMGLPFMVNPSVLIPRLDTEVVVEEAVKLISARELLHPDILDMCTGSGAIGISIAAKVPESIVTMTDVSDEALQTAMRNASLNKVNKRCVFLRGDMFAALPDGREFDMIVCNPPYIKTKVIDTLAVEVKDHEPREALDGGKDGLDYYRTIAGSAGSHLKSGGILVLEIGSDQAGSVKRLLLKTRTFRNIYKIKDLAGLDRGIIAERI